MFMVLSSWQSHCESSPGSFDDCRMAQSGRRPKTKPDDLGCESACTSCQNLHPPSPFTIITQPESWYSFYHPTEGLPSWLVTYRDGLPIHWWSPILVLTGSDVAQLRWSSNMAEEPQTSISHQVRKQWTTSGSSDFRIWHVASIRYPQDLAQCPCVRCIEAREQVLCGGPRFIMWRLLNWFCYLKAWEKYVFWV